MQTERVVVVGAGVAGLVAALDLAARGLDVCVLGRASTPGGKMREVNITGARLDAGPTVFTMRSVFEQIFADAGASFADHVALRPLEILARHAWSAQERLDLFSDVHRSADAIGAFAGLAEARGYLQFCADARRIYQTLDRSFIHAARPGLIDLVRAAGFAGLGNLWQIRPFTSMWQALGQRFRDRRLQQLFGRYATYCGSCPFLAPATLMLVAHVEQDGVWSVEGGMHRLVTALAHVAMQRGARFRYSADAVDVIFRRERITGVKLATGEQVHADHVIVNADIAAAASGRLGPAAAGAVRRVPNAARSLSAVTWSLVAQTGGFPLLRHNVFFSDDYAAEFDDIFYHERLPAAPTVYVCAQDRDDRPRAGAAAERLLCLINAPPSGDSHNSQAAEIEQCEERTFNRLAHLGLLVERRPETTVMTTPADFERLFPGTGGALYGPATHGWRASFRRAGARSRVPGLYFAGGSTHPGPGVPMAALSGRLAAATLMSDLASTRGSRAMATPGGTSMR